MLQSCLNSWQVSLFLEILFFSPFFFFERAAKNALTDWKNTIRFLRFLRLFVFSAAFVAPGGGGGLVCPWMLGAGQGGKLQARRLRHFGL